MRNLLGRLNARSADELGRIAAAWHVPVSGGDKLGQVAQLYRALTDIRAVRDVWTRLPEDERALIAALANGTETARPINELAAELGQSEADVRQTAARLYHKGILTREGDDDPLPVGEAPKLFLPRELALQFQRLRDEMEFGDVSHQPLTVLLRTLDEREIEEAAEVWGIRVVPGIRTRDELIRQILQQVGDPDRLTSAQGRLKRDAAKIWEVVRETPAGRLAPYSVAHSAAGLNADDPRHALRLRQALGELEEALLVWHTYGADGSRWLFVPGEIGTTQPRSPLNFPAPAPVATLPPDTVSSPEHAVAWDLLTVLRALAPPQDVRIVDVDTAPVQWLRRVNAGLWNRGADSPPSGYLDFLVDLARVEGIVTGGDAAIDEPFQIAKEMRAWRTRLFTEQTRRLRATWMSSTSWIEGANRDDVEVWGADWPGFRLKLLTHLSQLESGAFLPLDDVATWLAERDPDMLGATFQVATARNTEVAADDAASRRAAVAEVARATLESAFSWFGLVEIARNGRGPRSIRMTDRGRAVLHGDAETPALTASPGPALQVEPSGAIALVDANPLRVWSLSAFADLLELGPPARYEITQRSISRALRAGFEVAQIEDFLSRQAGRPLPGELAEGIRAWSADLRRVIVSRVIRVMPDNPAELVEIRTVVNELGLPISEIPGGLLIELGEPLEPAASEARLMSRLRELGLSVNGPLIAKAAAPPRTRQIDHRKR